MNSTLEITMGHLKNDMRLAPRARWTFGDLPLYYHPVMPQPDNETLANLGNRLMFINGSHSEPESKIAVAPKGEVWGGWVMGIIP